MANTILDHTFEAEDISSYSVPSNLDEYPEAIGRLVPTKVTNIHIYGNLLHIKYLAYIRHIHYVFRHHRLLSRLDQIHSYVEGIHAQNGAILHEQKQTSQQILLIKQKLEKLCQTKTSISNQRERQNAGSTPTNTRLFTGKQQTGDNASASQVQTSGQTTGSHQANIPNPFQSGSNISGYTSTSQLNHTGYSQTYGGQKDWSANTNQFSNSI